jgi:hypothetical protein
MRELLGCANLLLDRLPSSQAGDNSLDCNEVELAVGKKGKRQRVSIAQCIVLIGYKRLLTLFVYSVFVAHSSNTIVSVK